MEVFSVKNKNKNIEKIEQKKKDIILKVKIEQLRFGYANGYRQGGNTYTKKFLEHIALESQLYERAVYYSANLMSRS